MEKFVIERSQFCWINQNVCIVLITSFLLFYMLELQQILNSFSIASLFFFVVIAPLPHRSVKQVKEQRGLKYICVVIFFTFMYRNRAHSYLISPSSFIHGSSKNLFCVYIEHASLEGLIEDNSHSQFRKNTISPLKITRHKTIQYIIIRLVITIKVT